MTGRPSNAAPSGLTCGEVTELAGLYVLGALEADEARRVAEHLATCPEAHAEIAHLGGVVPALALAAEPIDAPAALRARVVADYAAAHPGAQVIDLAAERRRRAPRWLSWSAAAAAVLVIAVLGGVSLTAQQRADREAQRAAVLAAAIELMAAPGSSIALLNGSGSATGASGFAAFGAEGSGYIVMTGLPDAPAGMTYQAWYLVDGQPVSAGLMPVDAAGYALLAVSAAAPGTDVIALTIEPLAGSLQPTSAPIVAGELRATL
jgi:anti-sigma-K factor RskA